MKIASLDLGSNTFLLFIAEVTEDGITQVLYDETQVVRLAEKVQSTGLLQPETLKRVEACFQNYAKKIQHYQVDKVVAVATSAARDAKNSEELVSLGEKYNIPIKVISGKQEAGLTYKGSLYNLPNLGPNPLVIDVGGSSTEVIGSHFLHSFNIGSVRLEEACVKNDPLKEEDFLSLQKFVDKALEGLPLLNSSSVVAVAGTPTTLACLLEEKDFLYSRVHGKTISVENLEVIFNKLSKMTLLQRQQVIAMPAKRADVIVPGLFILLSLLKKLKVKHFYVSAAGIRYGLALQS
ncbi:MAG: hypothetical protein HAW63_01980 [Bdellovibrionaceae bacterium]|nr:hypothetical protein [Pseudobdellovibrionaceae bacterium]